MHTVEQAQEQILTSISTLPAEAVALADALGRFLAEPVCTGIELPTADNSAMDGYAVRWEDLASAHAENPVALRLIGHSHAGSVIDTIVEAGTCIRIFTGAVLPRGANAVVMQEDVKIEGQEMSRIIFVDSARPWENCRLRGEDIKSGAVVAKTGEKITAPMLSQLAAVGIDSVRAARRPVVGLLATGNELREPGSPLPSGGIYESNRIGLAALVRQTGAVPKIYPLVPDDLAASKSALGKAFGECDVVITTGGVSVGEADFVKSAFTEIGGKLDFWKVAMRPGKPFAFGRWNEKRFFGLPGNPASALVTFMVLTRPALLRMQGARDVSGPMLSAVLAEPLANPKDRRHFMRVVIDATGYARSAGTQASHYVSSLAKSAGLVDVPQQTTLPAGAVVRLMPWG